MAIVQGPAIAKEEKTQEKEGGCIITLMLASQIPFENYLKSNLKTVKQVIYPAHGSFYSKL